MEKQKEVVNVDKVKEVKASTTNKELQSSIDKKLEYVNKKFSK